MERGRLAASLLLAVGLALAAIGCEVHFGPLDRAPEGETPAPGGGGGAPRGEVWVYTSIYQTVIEDLTRLLADKYPDLDVKWYRAGSEVVARRLDAELRAGGTQADLVMTSDPFWYEKLAGEGRLATFITPDVLPLDHQWIDLDGRFVTSRISTMVIAYHPEMVGPDEVPRTFRDLTLPAWRGKVTLGDPLSSGTHFTTLAFLSDRYGWDYYEALRDGGVVASGGNSSVLRRVEGKEFPIGVVLLENVLANRAKGSPIDFVLPEDGAVTIPGPIAILASTDNPAGARAVYEVMMSPEGQRAMVAGNMHSANPRIDPPEGAPSLSDLQEGKFAWTPEFRKRLQAESADVKSRYDQIMNR